MAEFTEQFLGFLETREQRLLSWGFYDTAFSVPEIQGLIANESEPTLEAEWNGYLASGGTLDDLLDDMEQANLLCRVRHNPPTYRTRFAETVRLIARLRQMFSENQWAIAPNLVSDIKLHLKPRSYPLRNRTPSDCWQSLSQYCTQPDLQEQCFDALSHDRAGNEYDGFSAFQERAFQHILGHYNTSGTSGSIVSAGTGAGKTKAFYVPAFLAASTELAGSPSTKIIAIYPRNVLLADQLREAIAEAAKLQPVLTGRGLRPLRFGALLGNTPWRNAFDRDAGGGQRQVEKWHDWRRVGNGFIVPFLKSPVAPDEDLIWRDADRRAGRNCLYRASGNAGTPDVPDGVLLLTRDELMNQPPDVLFLSVEMLNREMGNPDWARTFGIGQGTRAPRLLLLDEVHSYEGIQGAQVAWILRRWRQWARPRNLHVVGLSATLKNATAHLSRVTAIRQEHILELRPYEDELEQESIEYNLAVKGDPAAGTSLLSTSIQTGMVLARTLTPRTQPPTPPHLPIQPERYYARKLFGFTDNLDVVNRWLSDMVDAERNRRLARLRLHPVHQQPPPNPMPSDFEVRQRNEHGQIWELPRRLGHNLVQPLLVTRCSSQDPGADTNADVIIATSSLEVGFDDPHVGGVIQHKRPMSIASFVQRKGRAGRQRGTRPWTVVVLSDYGGDRWAFQQPERLFDPELDNLRLPLRNPYVLRIQSAYFLIDWLGRRIRQGGPFTYLRQPGSQSAQDRAIELLRDILNDGTEWQNLRRDLVQFFTGYLGGPGTRLSEPQVDGLIWELPRPLLRHVIPSLLRKLEAGWNVANPNLPANYREDEACNHPLPEYLPKATFGSLDLAETHLALQPRGRPAFDEFLDVAQSLSEACPGRVSKRYSTDVNEPGYWHCFSPQLISGAATASVAVDPNERQRLFPQSIEIGNENGTRIFQPVSMVLEHRPQNVLDSSQSTWDWHNSFRPFGDGQLLPVFRGEPWNDVVSDVEAYLHRDQAGIDVIRYADSCRHDIRIRQQNPVIGQLRLGHVDDNGDFQREAIGFQRRVDGIRVRLAAEHLAAFPALDPALEARFRADYYLHRLQTTDLFPPDVNSFQAEWLWQISLAMLTATAAQQRCSLHDAQQHLTNRSAAADRVITHIFRVRDPNLQGQEGRLVTTIRDLWSNAQVVGVVQQLENTLWSPPTPEYHDWVRQRYAATLAQAFRSAGISSEMDVGDDDLAIDVVRNDDGSVDIYLTETDSGGLGQIEAVVQKLCSEPHRFHQGMHHVLAYCPRHKTTATLLPVVARALAEPHGALSVAFQTVRQSRGFRDLEQARESLRTALDDGGFEATRANVVSVVTRVLRPASSTRTDRFIHFLNRFWHRTEELLGVGIDSRVFAYYCVRYSPAERRLRDHFVDISGGSDPTPAQIHATVDQLLLPVCEDSCPECLHQPNRYNDFGKPSRALAQLWLNLETPEISFGDHPDDWIDVCCESLQQHGFVTISATHSQLPQVASALPELFTTELEVDILFHPISLHRIEKVGADWKIALQLKDLINA